MALGYLHASALAPVLFRRTSPINAQSMALTVKLQAELARESSKRANEEIHVELARQQHATEVAQASVREARDKAATEHNLRLAAERDRADALSQLAEITRRQALHELAIREAHKLIERERALRIAAEHSREVAVRRYKRERDAQRAARKAAVMSPVTVSW